VSLPHVLLGLLEKAPATGYDLARRMDLELDPSWGAGFSQIYPALDRLRRRGWVLARVLGPSRGPRRRIYRIAAAGRRELRRWLASAPPAFRGNDEGLVRIALLDGLPLPERRRALAASEAALGIEIARLRAIPSPGGFCSLARRAAIERLDAERRFLRSGGVAPLPALDSPVGLGPRKKR